MKKLVAVLLVVGMVLAFAPGCTQKTAEENATAKVTATVSKTTEPKATEGAPTEVPAEVIENFNAEGLPIVDETITLTAMQNKDSRMGTISELFTTKWLEEQTNIHIEYEEIDQQSWLQKKQLAFASSDLPDIFINAGLTTSDEMLYGKESSMLMPLNDLIDKYAPNILKAFADFPEYRPSITTPDGNIYAIGRLNYGPLQLGSSRTFINQAWIDNLGMKMPTTVAELHELLAAFKNNDPDGNGADDTIPVSGIAGAGNNDTLDLWFYAYGWCMNSDYLCTALDSPEEVLFVPYEPAYEDLLTELASLYQEGLIDSDYFIQTGTELKAKSSEVKVGLCMWGAPFGQGGMPEAYVQYVALPPLVCEYNSTPVYSGIDYINRGNFAMSAAIEHPEAVMRWVDFLYTEEAGIKIYFGPELGEFDETADYGYTILGDGTVSVKIPEGNTRFLYTVATWSNRDLPFSFPAACAKEEFAETDRWLAETLNSTFEDYRQPVFPNLYFEQKVQEELVALESDIKNYVEQMQAKFITGEEPLNNFAKFRENLENMGVERYIQIYQDAYDVYSSNQK